MIQLFGGEEGRHMTVAFPFFLITETKTEAAHSPRTSVVFMTQCDSLLARWPSVWSFTLIASIPWSIKNEFFWKKLSIQEKISGLTDTRVGSSYRIDVLNNYLSLIDLELGCNVEISPVMVFILLRNNGSPCKEGEHDCRKGSLFHEWMQCMHLLIAFCQLTSHSWNEEVTVSWSN